MSKILRKIYNFVKLLKINFRKYKIIKEKEKLFNELGFLIYEFYDIDKNFIESDEVKDLVQKIKDLEIELEELDNMIDEIKLSNIEGINKETEEISNELLLEEAKKDGREDKKSSENN